MARPRTDPNDLLSTPRRAWAALVSLSVSVAAGTLYVTGWRNLLLRHLGDVQVGALVIGSIATIAAGLGAAAAWRILWRGAIYLRGGGGGASEGGRGAHRPPLLSFGLVNLAAGLSMVVLLLMRYVLVSETEAWPQRYVLPDGLALPVRALLATIVVAPPLMCVGFGGGVLLHGWGRPRLGSDQTDWYHGLELPAALLGGVGLGLVIVALLTGLGAPYTDWVLLSALLVLVVSGAAVVISERLATPEETPRDRSRRLLHGRFRWRRFRAGAFVVGLGLGVYLVCTEILRRRAMSGADPGRLADALVTGAALVLMGMMVRRLTRGEKRHGRSEGGVALLGAGCLGLGVLAWVGWLGLKRLDGFETAHGLTPVGMVLDALPLAGVGWLVSLGITTSGSAGNRHARMAAGLGPVTCGAGLGALAAGLGIVPALGPEVGAVAVVLVMVAAGAVALATSHDRAASVRLGVGLSGVLLAGVLLGVVRQTGVFRRSGAAPPWERCAMSLWGEVTAGGDRPPRLNGAPLCGVTEPASTASLRGLVPGRLHGMPGRVLVHVAGDARMLRSVVEGDGAGGAGPGLIVLDELVPGVAASLEPATWLNQVVARPGVRLRRAAPGFPEHVAVSNTLYDLVVVDLRGGSALDCVRLACRETMTDVVRRLDEDGQAWFWMPMDRITEGGVYALLATGLDVRDAYCGVWLWEEPGGEAAVCALVVSRTPLGAIAGDAERFDARNRLMFVDAGRWPRNVSADPITAARPPRGFLHGAGRDQAEVGRTRSLAVAALKSMCRPVLRNHRVD